MEPVDSEPSGNPSHYLTISNQVNTEIKTMNHLKWRVSNLLNLRIIGCKL